MSTMKFDPGVDELTQGELKRLGNRHNLLKEPDMVALILLRGTLLKATRAFLESEGFVEVTTPTITGLTGACEDFSTLFLLDYFGHKAFLTQTAQLHLEPLIHSSALHRVYSINHI